MIKDSKQIEIIEFYQNSEEYEIEVDKNDESESDCVFKWSFMNLMYFEKINIKF